MLTSGIAEWITKGMDSIMRSCTNLPSENIPAAQVDAQQQAKPGHLFYPYKHQPGYVRLNDQETSQFRDERFGSIFWQLARAIPSGIQRLVCHSEPRAPSDDEFNRYLDRTGIASLGQHVFIDEHHNLVFEPNGKHIKGTHLKLTKCKYIDCKAVRDLKTFPGMSSMGSQVILIQNKLYAILLYPKGQEGKPIVVKPCDKAWSIAKLIAMYGINHVVSLQHHPTIHFPMSTIAVYCLQDLSVCNPVRWFLTPHLQFTIGINDLVLNESMSILVDHNNLASPFDLPIESVQKQQLETAFKNFKLDKHCTDYPKDTTYGKMLHDYHLVLKAWTEAYWSRCKSSFTQEHRAQVGQFFKHLRHARLSNWWKEPSDKNICEALTFVITKGSIEHAAEHHTYASIPSESKPWRWRAAFPQHAQDDSVRLSDIQCSIDVFQEEVCNKTFFATNPASLLVDVQYVTHDDRLVNLDYEQFKFQLWKVEERYPFVPLNTVAQSIDY